MTHGRCSSLKQATRRVGSLALLVFLVVSVPLSPSEAQPAASGDRITAFPGAQGWAACTPGGRGGQLVRVTTLASDGPGSFREAVLTKGRRIVVFEVGGVIDLEKKSVRIREPFVTIAGQTAPSPGITFIRGGIQIETHDVVIQHIRVRPGEAGAAKRSGWEVDAIATAGACNVIVDHCSCTWATDENLSASGPRFQGDTVEEWRQGTSHSITFSNCIIAEGLDRSTHGKGAHSKGSLIHDNATEIAIVANLYASNVNRNPLFKGGARGVIVNNFIFNPKTRAIHYRLPPKEWTGREYATGQMVIVGNVMNAGPDTNRGLPLLNYDGDGPCEIYLEDNIAVDRAGKEVRPLAAVSSRGPAGVCRMMDRKPLWPEGLKAMPANEVKDYVLRSAGARPWDRDEIDKRIVRGALDGTGRIIDSEQDVGGYPAATETRSPFDSQEWDLTTMVRLRE